MCGLVWLAGFIGIMCFLSLLTGSGLISGILSCVVVAVDVLGSNVIGVVWHHLASYYSEFCSLLELGCEIVQFAVHVLGC